MCKKICLLLLIGIPASGKTTYALNLCDHFNANYNIININYDCLLNLSEIFKQKGVYNLYRKNVLKLIEIIINDIIYSDNKRKDFLKSVFNNEFEFNLFHNDKPYVLILDDNMHLRSMRYNYYKLAKTYNLSYMQIFFNFDINLVLSRNNSRDTSNFIPEDIVKKIFLSLEKPLPKINKWERNSLILNSSDLDKVQVGVCILNALDNPECQIEQNDIKEQFSQDQTKIHKLDQLLRKEISSIIRQNKDSGTDNIQMYAELLNAKRKQILNDIKNNIITDLENVVKFLE